MASSISLYWYFFFVVVFFFSLAHFGLNLYHDWTDCISFWAEKLHGWLLRICAVEAKDGPTGCWCSHLVLNLSLVHISTLCLWSSTFPSPLRSSGKQLDWSNFR
ncbi:hypothetical protein RHGRI_001474 [Rhododendron griersonianum]|uniref:Secreted protein n=1 Tax=Rhododendron griersonianum TaxID=479676 RepID=A0AAV6LP53_9ERIC|nr:hypothetical protein RHGRI_001474 [Rhododendron griersonianum]